jgi:hypothetical protein
MTAQLIHDATGTETTAPATAADRGRVREACHRIRLAVQEINYASRRVVELQVPWCVDQHRHGR